MRIESGQQMFQHIENGGNLKLNSEGQLETQSAAGRFFQKIGDAFRSLSASGRAAIETRNTRLHEAMADMVRRDALVNPAQAEIQRPPITQIERNRMCASLAMAGELAKLPPESRAAARALVLHQLREHGVLNHNAATVRANIQQFMQRIYSDPVLSNGLKCAFSLSSARLQPMMNEVAEDTRAEFRKPTQQAHIENGIHASYPKDAQRDSVRSINGQPVNKDDLAGQLKALVPDEKMSSFISFAASQAGIEGSLYKHLAMPGGTKPNPDSPNLAEIQAKGLHLGTPYHKYELNIQNGKATIRLDMDVALQPLGTPNDGHGVGGSRYAVTMEIDLNQDMTGKDMPDFTLSGECTAFGPHN